MKILNLLCAIVLMGCATGKMGAITKPLDRTKVSKDTQIYIYPVSMKNTRFDGDKSTEQTHLDKEKSEISSRFHRKIISEMIKKGYKASEGSGKLTNGIAVKGHVSRFDHGSAAARSMVGYGAGASKLFTDFQVIDLKTNKTLGEFEIIATSGGRAGLSALGSFLDEHLDDGTEQFVEYVNGKSK